MDVDRVGTPPQLEGKWYGLTGRVVMRELDVMKVLSHEQNLGHEDRILVMSARS